MVGDVWRAAFELGVARLRLRSQPAITLIDPHSDAPALLDPAQEELVERVAFAIPRVAARLPWRADCLVQATAAQHWLARSGIGSNLHFGVPKAKLPEFEAHAWLTIGTRVVTGGDVSGYVPLER